VEPVVVMTCAINVPQKPTNHYTRKAQEDNFQLPALPSG
jgi:hypothetical protein